ISETGLAWLRMTRQKSFSGASAYPDCSVAASTRTMSSSEIAPMSYATAYFPSGMVISWRIASHSSVYFVMTGAFHQEIVKFESFDSLYLPGTTRAVAGGNEYSGLVRSVDRCEERTHAGEKPDTCDGEPYG